MAKNFLHLRHIEEDLTEVQKNWGQINQSLKVGRDTFSDKIKENLMQTYDYVNFILEEMDGKSIFEPRNVEKMIEINHRVLMGNDQDIRKEYHHHIMATREKFYGQIDEILKWVEKKGEKWLFKQEAAIFVAGVSQPQFFYDGNHRSNSTIVNVMSLQAGNNPFILNVDNARAFFEPAQEVKWSHKLTFLEQLKLLKKKKVFEKFFTEHSSPRYVSHKVKHLD